MKVFLKNVGLFCLICLSLNFLFNTVTSYSWNKPYSYKLEFVQKNPASANAFFWGSSRTFRQVIPSSFDSISASKLVVKSFNFGAPATFAPETYSLYESYLNALHDTSYSQKYAFLELNRPNDFASVNLLSKQNYYWLDLKYSYQLAKYHFQRSDSIYGKVVSPGKVFISFLFNRFGFNYTPSDEALNYIPLGPKSDGFYSLQRQLAESPNPTIVKRTKEFMADTSGLSVRMEMARNVFRSKQIPFRSYYNVHLAMLENLLAKSTEKGITLFFIIPPRLTAQDYQELLALKEALPNDRVLELGDPDKYPELWQPSNSFDIGHLNDKGAELYTQRLSSQFLLKCASPRFRN